MTIKTPKGTPVWALEALLALVVAGFLLFGGLWWANANDTLRNAATIAEVKEIVDGKIAPDRVKTDNIQSNLAELKQEFKEFKKSQEESLKEFRAKQDKMMEILLRMDGKK